jgi:hypothetical protein
MSTIPPLRTASTVLSSRPSLPPERAEAKPETSHLSAQDIVDRWLEPTARSVKEQVSLTRLMVEPGLEVTGRLLTGIPGAMLRLTWWEGGTQAALLWPKGKIEELPVSKRQEWEQDQSRVHLPDGTDLLVLRDSFRVEMSRSTNGLSFQSGFQLGLDLRYSMTDFELGCRDENFLSGASIGGDRLNSEQPRAWVKHASHVRSRALYATGQERPILFAPGASNVPVQETLAELDAAARTVHEKHQLT